MSEGKKTDENETCKDKNMKNGKRNNRESELHDDMGVCSSFLDDGKTKCSSFCLPNEFL